MIWYEERLGAANTGLQWSPRGGCAFCAYGDNVLGCVSARCEADDRREEAARPRLQHWVAEVGVDTVRVGVKDNPRATERHGRGRVRAGVCGVFDVVCVAV